MPTIWLDLRYALRTFGRSPGFAVVAVLTLALGTGGTTAIFSIVNGVLLRPLGYREPERLVAIQEVVPKLAQFQPMLPVSAHHFREWRTHGRSFEQIALLGEITLSLTSDGEPERLQAGRVSASLFPMLGMKARIGRTFLEAIWRTEPCKA